MVCAHRFRVFRRAETKNYHRAGEAHEQQDSLIPWIKEIVGEGHFADDSYGFAMVDLMLIGEDTRALVVTLAGMTEILDLPKEAVRGITIPVLGICGDHDVEKPAIARMIGVVEGFTFKLLQAHGHMDTDDDPQQARNIDALPSRSN